MNDTPRPDDVASIIGNAAREEKRVDAQSPDTVAQLAERVDLLIADFGKWEDYKAASTEYAREFTTEIKWLRWIRFWVSIGSAVMVLFLCGGLVVVLFNRQSIFGNDTGHALTALIVGAIGGAVVITIAAVKAVFASTASRNEGLPMPEHFKEVVDVVKNFVGK